MVVGGFITLADQFWISYQVDIMFAVLFVLVVGFLPETLYPRAAMLERGASALAQEKVDVSTIDLKRTKQLPFIVRRFLPQLTLRTSVKSPASTIQSRGTRYFDLCKCGHFPLLRSRLS